MNAIKRVYFLAWDVLFFLSGEGSWRLTPVESKIMNLALSVFSDTDRLFFEQQLKKPFFVERASRRIRILRFYEDVSIIACGKKKYIECLIRVEIPSGNGMALFNVTIFNGILFGIEFPKHIRDSEIVHAQTGRASFSNIDKSYTHDIDSEEHDP